MWRRRSANETTGGSHGSVANFGGVANVRSGIGDVLRMGIWGA